MPNLIANEACYFEGFFRYSDGVILLTVLNILENRSTSLYPTDRAISPILREVFLNREHDFSILKCNKNSCGDLFSCCLNKRCKYERSIEIYLAMSLTVMKCE